MILVLLVWLVALPALVGWLVVLWVVLDGQRKVRAQWAWARARRRLEEVERLEGLWRG